jgi:uncharacterized protein
MSQPWYRHGLKFACTGCGECCTGEPGYVWVNKAEIEALAAAVGLPVDHFERQYVRAVGIRKSLIELAEGDCVFFQRDSRKCRVYHQRPRQCRTWPFWPSNVATPAAWEATAERCPGCDRGRRAPLGKILAQLQDPAT